MRSIEKHLPIEQISPIAKLESWRKEVNRPVYYVHKWWARRLGSVFRALVLGSILDESDIWENYYKLHNFNNSIILDPFMGSGTTLGEALKLGAKTIGVDINPVSYFLVKKGLGEIDVNSLQIGFERLEQAVREQIMTYYQSVWKPTAETATVLYCFWVKLINCPNCKKNSRLFNKWIFSSDAYPKKKPLSQSLCPNCEQIHTVNYSDEKVECPHCLNIYNPQVGPAKRTTFICEHCGKEHSIIKTYQANNFPPEHKLYALMLLLPNGNKVYKAADKEDVQIYQKAVDECKRRKLIIPEEPIVSGFNTNQLLSYNYHYWHQMFNERQLLCLSLLLEGLLNEPDVAVREQLLLLFSGTLEFNNMFCSFKGEGTGAVRHLFSHHTLKPERMPLENNVWGTHASSGSFSSLFIRRILSAREYAEHPFELQVSRNNGKIFGEKVFNVSHPIKANFGETFEDLDNGKANALILAQSSDALPLPDASVDAIVTDPPYFDNVHYSELADFFYVWLKLGLRGKDLRFERSTTRHVSEVQSTEVDVFKESIGKVFRECHRVLKPDGVMIFTFHHSKPDTWPALFLAISEAGFVTTCAYPIEAEMSGAIPKTQAKSPINLDIVFVCKPKAEKIQNLVPQDFVSHVMSETKENIKRLKKIVAHLSENDCLVIGLSQFVVAAHHLVLPEQDKFNFLRNFVIEISEKIKMLN